MNDKADPYLEEMYYKNKYGEHIDIELARMYEEAKLFAESFCQLCEDVTSLLPTYEQLNKIMGIKRKE